MAAVVPHTFEIRFAHSAGLAAMLAAPTNNFRMKGGGFLSIEPAGISFAARRGITSLFLRQRTPHIAATDLTEVYREGAALRLEFSTADSRREVVPFWANDRDSAAEIVRLIPTSRTVELEHNTATPERRKFKPDLRVLAMLVVALTAGLSASYWLKRTADAVAPLSLVPIDAAQIAAPPVPLALPRPRLTPGSVPFESAVEQLAAFETQAGGLLVGYQRAVREYQDDLLTPQQFALELEQNLVPRWWNLTDEMLRNPWLADPELVDFRGALLACARHWRDFLAGYANGARAANPQVVTDAFQQLRKAEQSARLAASFVR